MNERTIGKALAAAVILLFICLAIQPSVAVQPDAEIDVEPKDYLFQTIIDIANNPEVKKLLEQYDNDMLKVDIDRSVYRKLILRNPRLMVNTLFTKPSMSVEYLNECYLNGIEITNVLGVDKVMETLENVEVTDTKWLDELKEMNKELNPVTPIDDIICPIAYTLFIFFFILTIFFLPIDIIAEVIDMISNPIIEGILILVFLPIYIPALILYQTTVVPIFLISYYLMEEYDCLPYSD